MDPLDQLRLQPGLPRRRLDRHRLLGLLRRAPRRGRRRAAPPGPPRFSVLERVAALAHPRHHPRLRRRARRPAAAAHGTIFSAAQRFSVLAETPERREASARLISSSAGIDSPRLYPLGARASRASRPAGSRPGSRPGGPDVKRRGRAGPVACGLAARDVGLRHPLRHLAGSAGPQSPGDPEKAHCGLLPWLWGEHTSGHGPVKAPARRLTLAAAGEPHACGDQSISRCG